MTIIAVELPDEAIRQLEWAAQAQKQSVPEVVRQLVLRELPIFPRLSDEEESELAAFAHLSDSVLWVVARSTLPEQERIELATLNEKANQITLDELEETRQDALLERYQRVILHRARAAQLLIERGYDLSNPAVLA